MVGPWVHYLKEEEEEEGRGWYKGDTLSVDAAGSPIDTIVELGGGFDDTTQFVSASGNIIDTTIDLT